VCTLSWLPDPEGFRLFFNRDERLTRAPERPPIVERIGGVRVITPADGNFGGTWIGVNEFGLAACLLNRYHEAPSDPPGDPISRGLLLRSLLTEPVAAAVAEAAGRRPLERYQPFTVAAASPGAPMVLLDWTGQALSHTTHAAPGMVRTSSGRDQTEAEHRRGAVLTAILGDRPFTAPILRAFHRSHLPSRGPWSVCMHRDDAATKSFTEIRVTPSAALLRYRDGPPCAARTVTTRHLGRRAPHPR
jgi:hypothetical protein